MKQFKFNTGLYEDWAIPVDEPGFDMLFVPEETPQQYGLLRDIFANGLNNLYGYLPYDEWVGNYVYNSEVVCRCYDDWRNIIESDTTHEYHFYGVIKPAGNSLNGERTLIDLYGQTEVFPLFVINNHDIPFYYEFIKVPTT
jgi:hypothetical protein